MEQLDSFSCRLCQTLSSRVLNTQSTPPIPENVSLESLQRDVSTANGNLEDIIQLVQKSTTVSGLPMDLQPGSDAMAAKYPRLSRFISQQNNEQETTL